MNVCMSKYLPMFCALPIHAIHFSGLPLIINASCYDSSCTIQWTSDYSYRVINYTLITIGLNTNETYIVTVPGNKNSHSFTELSINVMYNVNLTALFMCGGSTSNIVNIAINGECICN